MRRRTWAGVALVLLTMGLWGPSLGAQTLGTFSWQLQPFCNVVTVTITQQGAQYTVDGYDDQCGAAQRAPLLGLAVQNPDGTIGLGLHVITVPGGRGVDVDARISLATLNGPWSDSAGNAGTFAFGASTGGGPRPKPFVAGQVVPSGTTIVGEAIFDTHSSTNSASTDSLYIPLGAITPVALTAQTVNFNVNAIALDGDPLCTGTAFAPTAPPGKVCVYVGQAGGIAANSAVANPAALNRRGIQLLWFPLTGGGDEYLYITWAYTAP
jgi:hypothetical protein